MEVILFVGGVIMLLIILNLRTRVQELEKLAKISSVSVSSMPEQIFSTNPSQDKSLPVEMFPDQRISQFGASGHSWMSRLIDWIKEDWLLKLGAFLLLIGFGWLTTYAFLNNWVGPMGRISIGIIAGALFLLLGWWRIKTYLHQGGIFIVLGSTIILLTIFAAREIYDFFTPTSALLVMFLSTAFVAFVSVKYNSRSLALSSIILAGIAPLLTNASAVNYVGLFSYLLVIILGTIWIVAITGRRELTIAALLLVTIYSLPHLLLFSVADKGALLLFAYLFTAVFFINNTIGILKLKNKEIIPDLITAAGNGLFLLAWIMTATLDEWKSLIISAWMIVFAVGSFLMFRVTKVRAPFYVYLGVAVAMLATATSAELNGSSLLIAYSIESGIISFVAYSILRDVIIAERISFLLVGPVILSLPIISSRAWDAGVFHKDFFALLILGMTFFAHGLFFMKRTKEIKDKEPRQINTALLIIGSAYAYILLWLSLHAALINDDVAVMVSLVIYTIIGLIAYFYGIINERKVLRVYGGVFLGLVVARLLFVDVWRMELTGRITTFFLIGALLVSTAFLGKRKQKTSFLNNIS